MQVGCEELGRTSRRGLQSTAYIEKNMQETTASHVANTTSSNFVFLDKMGAVASSLCAIHCAISAILPSLLVAVGLGALLGHAAEWAFTLGAVALAAATLVLGGRRHRSRPVLIMLGTGIVGLLLSRLLEELGAHGVGTVVGVLAGLLLVVGHIGNIRATRSAGNEQE